MIVVGQLEGGAVQGIGQALCERVVYDRESGQPLTGTFLDYTLPRADMIRDFEMTMDESTPSTNNHLGVKGVGELGTIGATPTVVNAIVDALARSGLGSRRGQAADALHCRARVAGAPAVKGSRRSAAVAAALPAALIHASG